MKWKNKCSSVKKGVGVWTDVNLCWGKVEEFDKSVNSTLIFTSMGLLFCCFYILNGTLIFCQIFSF